MDRLKKIFLVGLFASAPLALTIYVVVQLIVWFDSLFQPVVSKFLGFSGDQSIPGVGILVGLMFILVVGVAAPSLLGRQFMLYVERIVDRRPFAKVVYSGTKQIFESFSSDTLRKSSRVVLVRFPHDAVWSIAFITKELSETEFPDKGEGWVAVFVPTTPVPTAGFLIFVESKNLIPLKMASEEALKYIVSCGLARGDLKRMGNGA